NLTNLVAAEQTGAGSADFLIHLALPSLVATTSGWVLYRRRLQPDRPCPPPGRGVAGHAVGVGATPDGGRHPRALVIGGALCAGLLVGFVAGPAAGVAPWMVALGADAVLVAVVRRTPWPHIPVATAATAGALAVLASAAVSGVEL